MAGDTRPDLGEIEACFVAVIEGRLSRDDADRWATRWLLDDSLDWDDSELWALDKLSGIDLPNGPAGGYLHDDSQVRSWLLELRQRSEHRHG
ncbi:hypothetical protein GCM10009839_73380 [Catenulispora yoronensis]|uniref:Uncharacterized protein n=1 Tax=Catenulispora yoronensis TaxID=450799 RepID=A0ABN2V8J6_9ACTN